MIGFWSVLSPKELRRIADASFTVWAETEKPIEAPDDTPAEPADDPVPEPTDPEAEPKP